MKECISCQSTKCFDNFYYRKDSQTHRSICKECFKANRKQYRDTNKEKVKESKFTYYYSNQNACCKRSRDWYSLNKDEKNERHAAYMKKRRQSDPSFLQIVFQHTE